MVDRISPEEVYEMMEDGEGVVLLDVRRHSWDESDVKAKGAIRINPDDIESKMDMLPKGKLIVSYCT